MNPTELQTLYQRIQQQANQVLVGLDEPFELLVTALIAGGHVLLEGAPGTAKTLMAKILARLVQAEYKRVQFTPDLMPSDIIGTNVFDFRQSSFQLRRGPIFTQILLGDEINRAPAKTQSALLEAMEERQVNLDGTTHELPSPFMVIATQNPIEYEGTYPLPEAQLDRFLFKISLRHASVENELQVLRRYHAGLDAHQFVKEKLSPIISPAEIAAARQTAQQVTVEPGLLGYIQQLVQATRNDSDLTLGVSTRAAVVTLLAGKTLAALRGRSYLIPDDIKEVLPAIFRHRLLLKPEAEIEGLNADAVIQRILRQVEVPR